MSNYYSLITCIPGFDLEGGDTGLSRPIFISGNDPELVLHPWVQICHLRLVHTAVNSGWS